MKRMLLGAACILTALYFAVPPVGNGDSEIVLESPQQIRRQQVATILAFPEVVTLGSKKYLRVLAKMEGDENLFHIYFGGDRVLSEGQKILVVEALNQKLPIFAILASNDSTQ